MKVDIGLVFKYILAIIIPLIVYFGIGWIAKDIYFSIWEIVDSTTLEEIYNKEVLVYACVAVGYIILCHIILDNNSPDGVMVFAGAFALCSDNDFKEDEMEIAKSIYSSIGVVELLPEHLIDAACALNGGGPAYVAMFIEAMADGGVKQGLPRATAYRLAEQTCLGTAKMLLEMDIHPGALKDMVTSPAGTTIEGCEALERGGMRASVTECIKAAAERSRQL